MVNDLEIDLMLVARSPITHTAGSEGNETVIMRESVLSDGVLCTVPVLTGNAIRNRAIRQPGMWSMIAAADLEGKLSIRAANFLLNGGAVSESTRDADLKIIAEGKALMPLFAVLGGCLPNQIVPGRLSVGRGLLACRENAGRLRARYGEWMDGIGELRPAEDFIDAYQYTRGAERDAGEADNAAERDESLMIFSGESIVAGAIFFSQVRLRNPTGLQIGALFNALRQWDGDIGGQAARGHGAFDVYVRSPERVDRLIESCTNDYDSHLNASGKAIAAWIGKVF